MLRREGFTAAVSTVGRVIKSLVERGVVEAVPSLPQRLEDIALTA